MRVQLGLLSAIFFAFLLCHAILVLSEEEHEVVHDDDENYPDNQQYEDELAYDADYGEEEHEAEELEEHEVTHSMPTKDDEPAILDGAIQFSGPEHSHLLLGGTHEDVSKKFMEYLARHNVQELHPPNSRLEITGHSPGSHLHRGLAAVRHVAQGETLMSIPFSAALVLEDDDPEPFAGSGPYIALAAKLLRELAKGEESRHWPYLATFPRWVPMPWATLEPEEFRESQWEGAERRLDALLAEYGAAFAKSDARRLAFATWAEFAWAIAMVTTRAFTLNVPVSEGSPEKAPWHMFVPIADLLSHDPEGNVDWHDAGVRHNRLDLVATRAMRAGELATASFGHLSTESFAVVHGFVPPSNPHDFAIVFDDLSHALRWFLSRYHRELRLRRAAKVGDGSAPQLSEPEFRRFYDIALAGAHRYLVKLDREHEYESLAHPPPAGAAASPHDDTHGGALAVFPDGTADTRLVGALSGVQLELDGLLRVATESDWEVTYDEVYDALVRRCAEELAEAPTSVREDEATLAEIEAEEKLDCHDEVAECDWVGTHPAMELIIKFRAARKRILEAFVRKHGHPRRSSQDQEEL